MGQQNPGTWVKSGSVPTDVHRIDVINPFGAIHIRVAKLPIQTTIVRNLKDLPNVIRQKVAEGGTST
jgi:hypothetical protein